MVLKPSSTAAATIASAPSTTLATFALLAPFNSPKRRRPHRMPTREFVFHKGNAIVKPTSRMAKTVRVLATAHNMPARIAQTMRCLFSIRSATTYLVPFRRVGRVHRAVKTPATMHSEIEYGDSPALTNFVGASAAPSHTPAPSPQATPIPCIDPKCWTGTVFVVVVILSTPPSIERYEKCDADAEHGQWNHEVG